MGPRLLESPALSHKSSLGGSRRTEKRRGSSPPLSASQACGLPDGGKHFLHLGGLQFLQRFCFDLANSFPRHREALPYLLQCAGLIVADTEAQPDDSLLSGRKHAEYTFKLVRQFCPMHVGIGLDCLQVGEQFPKFRISVTHRLLKGDWLLEGLHGFAESLRSHS